MISKSALWAALAVLILFVVAEWSMVAILGVKSGGDTDWHIRNATDLIQLGTVQTRAWSYIGYYIFLSPLLILGLSPAVIVGYQIFISVLAVWAMYGIGKLLYDRMTGCIAAILFAVYPLIHQWDMYVLTESLYISLSVIAVYFVVRSRRLGDSILALLITMAVSSIRPHGIVLLAAVIVYYLLVLWCKRKFSYLIGAIILLLLVSPLAYSVISLRASFENPGQHWSQGTVIWGYPALNIVSSPDLYPARYVLRLMFSRLFYFFADIRPFYHVAHNWFIFLTLYPLYLFAAKALWKQGPLARILPSLIIVFQAGLTSITFVDWDGRFLHVILPYVFILSAAGISTFIHWRLGTDSHLSSSLHTINADKGLSVVRRVEYAVYNGMKNMVGNTGVASTLRFRPFAAKEVLLNQVDPLSSPSRQVGDMFWLSVPWDRIKQEVGDIHLLDIGCGSGDHAGRFQEWSKNTITSYTGFDVVAHNKWEEITKKYPWAQCKQVSAHDMNNSIPIGTNVIVTQSTLEHIDYDLLFFQQIREYTVKSLHPVIQIHLVPAAACLPLYLWHGLRQYTPRTLTKIWEYFSDHGTGDVVSLGSKAVNSVHWRYITVPSLTRQADKRKTNPEQYKRDTRQTIIDSLSTLDRHPSFYALVIHAKSQKTILA